MAELPFVEKYRPESLEDLAGNGNVRALKAFVKTGQFPLAMIFYGTFGTGKTTAARATVRDYYVANGLYLSSASFRDIRSGTKTAPGYEGLFPPVLYVDATITRDIDFIKNTVQQFMKTFAPMHLKKFIVIDEGDRLSRDAQGTLRSLLEKYPNTVTIWTTNSLHNIDPAIQDRASGAVFEFLKPSVEDVVQYLKKLSMREYAEIPDEKLRQIAVESESLRQAVGRLGTEVAIFRAEHAAPPAHVPKVTTTELLMQLIPLHEPVKEETLKIQIKNSDVDIYSVDGERAYREALGALLRSGDVFEPRPEWYRKTGKGYAPGVVKAIEEAVVETRKGIEEFEQLERHPEMARALTPTEKAALEFAPTAEMGPKRLETLEERMPELENPPEETVYVKIQIEGGVEAKEDGKPKIETPEFVIMCTTYEEYAKHGNTWIEDMWSRPLVGMFGVPMLADVLKEEEQVYDAAEDNMLTWGNDPDAIKEALAGNPPPFNHIAVFHVKWRLEDITWTESAKQAWDIFHFKYTREALEKLSKDNVRLIAKIKDVHTGKDEAETIGNIVAHDAYAEEIHAEVTAPEVPEVQPPRRFLLAEEREKLAIKDADLPGKTSQELVVLIRMGHPTEQGQPYSRSGVIQELRKRGRKVLVDLGWPTDMNAIYRNIPTGSTETLEDWLKETDKFDNFRTALHESEEKLSSLTKDYFKFKGLECTTLKEAQNLAKMYPAIMLYLKEAIRLHKGFYEYYRSPEAPTLLTDPIHKSDQCMRNVANVSRWLGLDVSKVEPPSTLPPLDPWTEVWSLVEHYSPETITPAPGGELEELVEEAVGELESVGESALKELEEL